MSGVPQQQTPPPQVDVIPPVQRDFRGAFKDYTNLLIVGWGATLVSMIYMHDRLSDTNYDTIMDCAALLVAGSFLLWLTMAYVYETTTSNPAEHVYYRLPLSLCFATAIAALGITFITLYFPGDHTLMLSGVFGCSAVAAAFIVELSSNHYTALAAKSVAAKNWIVAKYTALRA